MEEERLLRFIESSTDQELEALIHMLEEEENINLEEIILILAAIL
jgi:hypothetical protein